MYRDKVFEFEFMASSVIWQPDDLLAREELVAVDEDAGDVAEEEDEDDADKNRSQVHLLLHRGSCPRMGQSNKSSLQCKRNAMEATRGFLSEYDFFNRWMKMLTKSVAMNFIKFSVQKV